MIPEPTPEPTNTSTTSSIPRAAPNRRSPQAATARPFATFTRVRSADERSSPNGTSRQPRFGALRTMPVAPRHCPATPTPTQPDGAGGSPAAVEASAMARWITATTAVGARSRSGSLCTATISPESVSTTAARAFVPPRSTPSETGATALRSQLAQQLVDLAAHQRLDLVEARLRLRLEAQHEERL